MNRTVNVITPLGDALKFKSLKGHEGVSCLSEWTVQLVSDSPTLDLQSMIGQDMTLEIETGDATRFLNGVVTGFALLHRETETARYYIYQATVRSWLWYATQSTDNRIFQNESAVSMIKKVLSKYDFAIDDRLVNTYRQWGYCVQFQETDFNFVSRLMEHEGIYYWFRHEPSRHVLVLSDEAQSHGPLPVLPAIAYYPDDRASVPMQEYISDWQISGELTPTGYATMDYDFQKPRADMSARRWARTAATGDLDMEMYEPMGGYIDSADSEHYAKVHLESLQCLREQSWAQSTVRSMAPGYTFTLKNAPNQAENGDYLIIHTEYDIQNPAYASHDQPTDVAWFLVASRHIPASVQYRAPRITPVPKMSGPQTATVVGPAGEEIWTDKFGRIKVQFHWDREGAMDDNSSCWIRVSNPWAGGGFGGVQIPRVHEEVVVDFINGNIDRPIVVGRVYNASNMPPVNLPADAMQSGFVTRTKNGSPDNANKLLFEDRQGSELLSMRAEIDMNTHVKNNQSQEVVGNVVSSIAGLRSHTAHSSSDISMASGAIKSYQADHNRTVQGSLDEQIGANLQQTFSDGVDETITGPLTSIVSGQASHTLQGLHITTTTSDDETVNGTVSETIGTGETSNIKGGSQLQAGDITVESPTVYSESTQQEIDIKAGGPLDISSAGPGIVQTPGNISKESPANVETALMLDNNTVTKKKSYTLDLSVDGIKDVMVAGHNHNQNIADIKAYGMGDSMQAANVGLYGANIQIGGMDQKMGLVNVNITGIELDKGFKIKRTGGGAGAGTKGKGKDGNGGDGGKGGKGDKDGNGNRGDADKPHADCKECTGRIGGSIGLDVGDERFVHTDFFLPGPFPVEWRRIYRSNMPAKDVNGELGARWVTPYTVFVRDENNGRYEYIAESGRSIAGKQLEPGEVWYDRTEELIWSRPDADTLVVSQKHERVETFERAGNRYRLKRVTDRIGNIHQLIYSNESDLLIRIETRHYTVAFSHDSHGRITKIAHDITGENGEAIQSVLAQYTYDEFGDLVMSVDQYQRSNGYAYQNHLITRYTDKTGRGINLEWDGEDYRARCVREYRDDGSCQLLLHWDTEERKTYVTDALGSTTVYSFDAFNYIAHIDFPDGTRQSRIRDEFHNIVEVLYPDHSSEKYEYDQFDNIIKLVRADNSAVCWQYDEYSQITKIVDPGGNVWTRDYDARGNMIRETDPKGFASEFQYTLDGNLIKAVNPKGGVSTLQYNGLGLLAAYSDCSNKTRRWEYDILGRTVREVDPNGNETTYQYGRFGFISEMHRSDASVLTVDFDEEGRLLSFIDPVDNLTRYEYDRAGRIHEKIDPLNQHFVYNYDKKGRLSSLVNENGDQFRFEFDPVDRMIRSVGFDGKVKTYNYDKPTGLLFSIQDADRATHFEYDIMGQLLVRRAGSLIDRFEYDIANRIVRARSNFCDQSFEYDVLGNPVRETHSYAAFGEHRQYVWENEFDELSDRISTRRADGVTVNWLRYGAGHVHGIELNQQEVLAFDRDNNHQVIKKKQANALTAQTIYDSMGRVKEQKLSKAYGNRSALRTRSYSYLKDGSLGAIVDSGAGMITYRYDALDRLVSANIFDETEIFAFDPASNLLDKAASDVARPANTLPQTVSKVLGNILRGCAGIHFEYDVQGNLVRKHKPDALQELEWDEFGRLRLCRTTDLRDRRVSEAAYIYDTFGRRIGKAQRQDQGTEQVTFYGWDGHHLAFEESGTGNMSGNTHYLYEEDSFEPLLQYRFPESSSGTGNAGVLNINYYHCDHLGTPQLLTNEHGHIVWEGRYSALGKRLDLHNVAPEGVTAENRICFQGQYYDCESGLHYNRFRYYDPDIGRFIQQDPIGLLGDTNFYTYAPNTANWIDPFGLMKILRSTWNSIRNNYYKGKGGQVNHAPAYGAYDGLDGAPTRGRGPAYWMETADHRAMATTGSSRDAVRFRGRQRQHIMNGNWDRAIAMDIDDLNNKFPGKYNTDFNHMLDEHVRQGNITQEQRQQLSDRLKNTPGVC